LTRLSAADRKSRIIEVMAAMAMAARDQSDFTAAKVAEACGVSTTMLYRLASPEFRAARASLPGIRSDDSVLAEMRRGLREARREVERLRQVERIHEACPTRDEIRAVILANEHLEEENRSLRSRAEFLRRRVRGDAGS
jgi:hypothetical protein